ncbi:glycosyltransferase family 2 protein [bacterium]|nr:glycosyltransferase family 2 protein [bacterium]
MPPTRITVGIPTFNRANYLSQAVESVLAQDFEDFELLVVDNASTDHTPEVMEAFVRRDARVRYVRNAANLGMGGNWWRLVDLAHHAYLKMLMDDDLLKPGCLSAFDRAIDQAPTASLIASLSDLVDDRGTVISRHSARYAPDALVPGAVMLRFLLRWTNQIGCPTNVMFKRDALLPYAEAVWRDAPNSWSPDFEMMGRVLRHGDFLCINQVLASIRHHPGSLTASMAEVQMQEAEWRVLRQLAQDTGDGPEADAWAELHAARTAFVRGLAVFYRGDLRLARTFLGRWAGSPMALRASKMALAHSRGRVLIPPGLLKLALRARRAPRASSPLALPLTLPFRYQEMERDWHRLMPLQGDAHG